MASLDLMGTHSSPVDSANKYLRVIGGYRFYQFTALPFSIATVFSQVHQGSKGGEADGACRRHQYSPVYRRLANDNNSKQQCQENTYWLVHLVESLGWITNFEKSDLFLTQVIKFLVTIRPQGRASLPNSKEISCLLGRTVTLLKVFHLSPGKLMSL